MAGFLECVEQAVRPVMELIVIAPQRGAAVNWPTCQLAKICTTKNGAAAPQLHVLAAFEEKTRFSLDGDSGQEARLLETALARANGRVRRCFTALRRRGEGRQSQQAEPSGQLAKLAKME